MSRQREVLPNRTEAREKRLSSRPVAKATYLAFASSGGLVAILSAVVHARSRFDEYMLHMSELGNILSAANL